MKQINYYSIPFYTKFINTTNNTHCFYKLFKNNIFCKFFSKTAYQIQPKELFVINLPNIKHSNQTVVKIFVYNNSTKQTINILANNSLHQILNNPQLGYYICLSPKKGNNCLNNFLTFI
jgi:hypothetical protein